MSLLEPMMEKANSYGVALINSYVLLWQVDEGEESLKL
jgi:hypothetical protein